MDKKEFGRVDHAVGPSWPEASTELTRADYRIQAILVTRCSKLEDIFLKYTSVMIFHVFFQLDYIPEVKSRVLCLPGERRSKK